MRSFKLSMTAVPSVIASTSMPRIFPCLRTILSIWSFSNSFSSISSVKRSPTARPGRALAKVLPVCSCINSCRVFARSSWLAWPNLIVSVTREWLSPCGSVKLVPRRVICAVFVSPSFTIVSSSKIVSAFKMTWPESGSIMSSANTRPESASFNISSASRASSTKLALTKLKFTANSSQSEALTITSCATSTSRRVKYPLSAVLSAVSAKPLRAPWLEMK